MKFRSINSQKKNEANIQPSCPNKLGQQGLRPWLSGTFFLRDTVGSLSGQDGAILSSWVANHSVEFDSSCLLTERAI